MTGSLGGVHPVVVYFLQSHVELIRMNTRIRGAGAVLAFTLCLLLAPRIAQSQQMVPTGGFVLSGDTPVCALVLINGQSMFSCDGNGRYDLDVPLDTDGLLTVQIFASGFAPFRSVIAPREAVGYDVQMERVKAGATFQITANVVPRLDEGRAQISGTVNSGAIPVCALVLANGEQMFSCDASLGLYDLDVPLDSDGNITLQVFAAGFQPYRQTLDSSGASNNFTAVSLDSETLTPTIGYPLTLSITLEAAAPAINLPVTFYAFDPDDAEAEPVPLGASVIEVVEQGRGSYQATVSVPADVTNPQSYFVGASLDPLDAFTETDEEDNQTSVELTISLAQVPNLFIDYMQPDVDAIVLDRDNWDYAAQVASTGQINADAGGNVRWGGQGLKQMTAAEAYAVLRLKRDDRAPSDVLDIPLYLWDTIEQRYINAYGIDPRTGVVSGVPEWLPIGATGRVTSDFATEPELQSAHLDFYFPGRLGSELEIVLRNLPVFNSPGPVVPPPDLTAEYILALRGYVAGATLNDVSSELCVSIRPVNQDISEFTMEDNEACSPLQLVLPPVTTPPPPPGPIVVPPIYDTQVEPYFKSEHYPLGWPGDFFGVSLDLNTSTSIDNNGIVVTGLAEVPVTLFGQRLQFVGIESRAQLIPDSDGYAAPDFPPEPGSQISIMSLDLVLYSSDRPPESTGQISLSYSVDIPNENPPQPPKLCCTVGPVPINYTAGVTGNVGLSGEIIFESGSGSESFIYNTTFTESAEASMQAFANLAIARLGVEGVLSLLSLSFPIDNRSEINVLDERHFDGTSEVEVINQYQVRGELAGPEGSINVFVEVGAGRKCKWGIFSFVCKVLPNLKYSKSLVSWAPFRKLEFILVDDTDVIDVVTLPDGTVAYYSE